MSGKFIPYFKPYFLFVLLLWSSVSLWAQNTKDTLREINITAPKPHRSLDIRNQFSAGQQKISFDSTFLSLYRQQSLAELIADQSPVFVKSYGINSMATLSIRGASAAQSAVLWNGIPITNAAMGLADISLLQGGLFSNISIQYGGSSALFGSSNVGGLLLLEDKVPDFKPKQKLTLSLGAGSFGHRNGLVRADWQNHHWHFGLKAFWEQAKNNFSYLDNQGNRNKMTNAALSGKGGIFSADYIFPQKENSPIQKQTLSIKFWYQQYDREIPPALFEAFSVKKQDNRSFRSLIEWQQQRKRSYFYGKFSFNKDYLLYQDDVVLPNNENKTNQWYVETGWKWQITPPTTDRKWLHELLVFIPVQWAYATGENLGGKQWQWRPAVVAAYKMQSLNDHLNATFTLRREWWHHRSASWLPGWNTRWEFWRSISSKNYFSLALLANVQKSYRVPNLNELYFSPGGNPDLKPEHGRNEDAGFIAKLKLNRHSPSTNTYSWQLSQHTALFNRNIKDWIYWLGGAIWTPHNLAEVHSRGLETETKISWQQKQTRLSFGLKTAYVLATTTQSYLPNDGSIGSQIPYTPRYNGNANLSFSLRGLFLNYNHQYTGYRFVTTDESQFLKPYQTGNLQMAYTFIFHTLVFTISGQIRNIWDKHYEIVNGRPMPGRHFMISLRMDMHGK